MMMRKPPPYVQQFTDRHGGARFYFRRPGYKRVPLPGLPWSPEFMAAHEAAMTGETVPVAAARTKPGSIDDLVARYYVSAGFKALRPISQRGYRNVIERFRAEHGGKSVVGIQREHVEAILAKLADRPAAANRLRKMLKLLMGFSIEQKMRRDNPTLGIKKTGKPTAGFHSWTEAEIVRFEARHPAGSRARLAFDLLLYTAQRREDVRVLGRQHLRGGKIALRQSKTGTEVIIPIHADLAESLAGVAATQMTFLLTEQGKPFTAAGFTNWFRDRAKEAGLPPGVSPHGLRKAACRRLAEAGCSAIEIMSISGHKSLSECQRYVEAANREKMAETAMARIGSRTPSVKPDQAV